MGLAYSSGISYKELLLYVNLVKLPSGLLFAKLMTVRDAYYTTASGLCLQAVRKLISVALARDCGNPVLKKVVK